MAVGLRQAILIGVLTLAGGRAGAHDFSVTQVMVVFRQDGGFLADMRVDVDALALGVSASVPSAEIAAALEAMPGGELDAAIERARDTLSRRVWLRFDGEKADFVVSFPGRGPRVEVEPEAGEPTVLGTTARLEGRVPDGAVRFTFGASRAFNAVQLTILDEVSASGTKFVVGPGAESPAYRLHEVVVDDRGATLVRYLLLGFEHILPKGLDHILFVFSLFLLSARLRPLLWQTAAFTVAHSITLALAMADVASLPSRVVEPLIALSIAYVAAENLFLRELKPWRTALVFAFGLLHGMGFAGVLRELGMPEGQFVVALVGFNVGVEAGQVAVVALAFLALGWFRDRTWYRRVVVQPLSLAVALVGAYWAVQRAFGL